jgi:nicotinamidase/pyrazinamidase
MSTTLLLIDVQNDFHPPNGSLAIPNAGEDANRIASTILSLLSTSTSSTTTNEKCCWSLDRIVVTMDSHDKFHIAHPSFWLDATGLYHPPPFTIIRYKDIVSGIWQPYTRFLEIDNNDCHDEMPPWMKNLVMPPSPQPVITTTTTEEAEESEVLVKDNQHQDDNEKKENVNTTCIRLDLNAYVLEYTRRLEEKGKFQLCIWPEHCLIGSHGHDIVDNVGQALEEWSRHSYHKAIKYILKGQNVLTEMYSALEAEIPISQDTYYNDELLTSLLECGKLVVCGQAMSHCVNYTLRDIVRKWPPSRLGDIYLLKDCASAVPGFEADAEAFLMDMKAAGVQVVTSTEFLQEGRNPN